MTKCVLREGTAGKRAAYACLTTEHMGVLTKREEHRPIWIRNSRRHGPATWGCCFQQAVAADWGCMIIKHAALSPCMQRQHSTAH